MSAVHGPIPCTAVSAACAASASIAASEVSASRSLATARAISLSARIFGAERPSRASFDARARMMACGSNGSNAAARRAQIAAKRASALVKAVSAASRSLSVRMWVSMLECIVQSSVEKRSVDVQPRFAFRTIAEWLFAPGPCLFRIAQFRHGARAWRTPAVAHRRYRYRALPPGIRSGDLRGFALAWHVLARAGAPAERAFCRLRDGDRPPRSRWPALSELRKPPGVCHAGGGARSPRRLAARSGRRANLSGGRAPIVGG